jgi:hypothetical protein
MIFMKTILMNPLLYSSFSDAVTSCSPYTAKNTSFAFRNYVPCYLYACPGTTITASGCGADNGDDAYYEDVSDQYLSLYDPTGLRLTLLYADIRL